MKKLLAIILTLVLALMMAVPAFASSEDAFDQIFPDRGIIHLPAMFLLMDYHAYACVTADGVVDCMEFAVEDDIIYEWVETIYIPTEGMNNEEKTELKKNMEDTFAAMDKEKFCTVSTYQMMDYLSVKLEFADLNDSHNLSKMVEFGFIENDEDLISMNITEEMLLAQGYVKDI